jgi:hypothetical protein
MRPNWKKLAILAVGYLAAGYAAWLWLGLNVATTVMVAVNGALAAALLLAFSALDAFGLGDVRKWLWAIPANALVPFMGYHFGLLLLIPLLWVLILFPSAALGKLKILAGPRYLVTCILFLAAAALIPYGLMNWVPAVSGLNMQLASFALRAGLAYIVFIAAWGTLLDFIGREARAPEGQHLTAAMAGDQPVGA